MVITTLPHTMPHGPIYLQCMYYDRTMTSLQWERGKTCKTDSRRQSELDWMLRWTNANNECQYGASPVLALGTGINSSSVSPCSRSRPLGTVCVSCVTPDHFISLDLTFICSHTECCELDRPVGTASLVEYVAVSIRIGIHSYLSP